MKSTENLKKLRSMKIEDLAAELKKVKKEANLTLLKIQAGKFDNFSEAKKLKKNIAQILSVTYEKQFGEQNDR